MRAALVAVVALALLAAGGIALLGSGFEDDAAAACPEGYVLLSREQVEELRQGARIEPAADEQRRAAEERERETDRGRTLCLKDDVKRPEPFADLARIHEATQLRLGVDRPSAYRAAVRAKARVAGANTSIPGTAGTWTPIGKGQLRADDPAYPLGSGTGFSKVAGRITDFAHDPETDRLYAAVANGGVWVTADRGGSWRSIGDTLPTQVVGAVGWTRAGGGTLIALTGDNAFGGTTFGGDGAYVSDDEGRTWSRARGIPAGAMGFRVAVRPDEPDVVYAATGLGLFRSTDAGRSWTDVELPTGRCAGRQGADGCFLANVVTDVVVQGRDQHGNQGGAVMAAVGWRAADKRNPDGTVQAPANGIYTSEDGRSGTFRRRAGTGFPGPSRTGRVSLGIASGPGQDQDHVYALVQDAVLFNTGTLEGLDIGDLPDPLGLGLTSTPTYLEGVYVTPSFGGRWNRMATRQQFLLPTSGSSLAPLSVLGFGPGIQAWYNSFIQPDPGSHIGGVPTRVALGLEEVFESRTAGAPQNILTDFVAVGPYNATGAVCILVIAGDICAAKQAATPDQTTTHPDQHGAIYLPGRRKGERSTLVVGNDGGAYFSRVPALGPHTPASFGKGANEGFNTLLPYGVAKARDGTVYAGLQDNGTMKVEPGTGRQVEIYGGDGTYVLTDPDNAQHVLLATPNGGLNLSRDGGRTYTADPSPADDTDAQFLAPFALDETDGQGVVLGTRQIHLADARVGDLAPGRWKKLFDLGTQKRPGDAAAQPTKDDPVRVANTVAIRGGTIYAGWCGTCDPVRDTQRFAGGIATNVGGEFRFARSEGLPQRIVNHVAIDPDDPRTVYVALGTSTARPYAPPKALGDDGTDPAGGFVYKSTDGGETFRDITGDLPRIGATWLLVRGGQLVAATTVGVFASRTREGGEWGLLGDDLPAAPVFSLQADPADANRLVAASFGRGLWSYEFKDPVACVDQTAPVSRFSSRARRVRSGRRLVLRGTARDRGCAGVRRVQVAIARKAGRRCRHLQPGGRFARRATSCARTRYLTAKGTSRWSFTTRRALPAGSYQVWVRAVDRKRNTERKRFARNGRRISARAPARRRGR